MVKEIEGDLLTCGADVICHQTNVYGVMGAGVAAAIWSKLLNKADRRAYEKLCAGHTEAELLGTVQYLENHGKPTVANCFSQREASRDGNLTDYGAFRSCMETVRKDAEAGGLTVALPGYMGCGIAGGDWTTVHGIIEDVFGASSVSCTIVYLKR